MSDADDIATSLARLEMALEGIDAAVSRSRAPKATPPAPADTSNAEIATRLDTLIEQLRTALASPVG